MKAKATKLGYYGHQRVREGDVFIIEDEKAFSEKWMERVEGKASSKPEKAKKEEKKEVDSDTEVI